MTSAGKSARTVARPLEPIRLPRPAARLRDPDVQRSYSYVDTGMIAANVYLYAASVGLAVWFHNCDRSALEVRLGLRPDERVLFGQTIGYPSKKGRGST